VRIMKLKERNAKKREEAEQRSEEYQELTVQQKIARASSQRGESKKVLAKLKATLTKKESKK